MESRSKKAASRSSLPAVMQYLKLVDQTAGFGCIITLRREAKIFLILDLLEGTQEQLRYATGKIWQQRRRKVVFMI